MLMFAHIRSLLLIAICLAAIQFSLAAEERPVEGNDLTDVLRRVAAENEANYRLIRTWKGKYRFLDRFPYSKPVPGILPDSQGGTSPPKEELLIVERHGDLSFKLDVEGDILLVNFDEDGDKVKSFAKDGGVEVVLQGYSPYDIAALQTSKDETTMPYSIPYGPQKEYPDDPNHRSRGGGRLARKGAVDEKSRENQTDEIIDPRQLFQWSDDSAWNELRMYVDALAGKYSPAAEERLKRNLRVASNTRADGKLMYTLRLPFESGKPDDDKRRRVLTVRFSESEGFLPVEETYLSKNGQPHEIRTWEYVLSNGVRIPKRYRFVFNNLDTGELILDRTLELIESEINGVLGEITLEQMVPPIVGDRLVDEINHQLLVHDGVKYVPASEYKLPIEVAKTAERKYRSPLFWINLAGIALAGCYWVWWRRKAGRVAQP